MFLNKIKVIYILICFLVLIFGFIYLKNRNFNYNLIGLSAQNVNESSPSTPDYLWEFKTIIYDGGDIKDLKSSSGLKDDNKIIQKFFNSAKEPLFFNVTPIISSKKGEFEIQPIPLSEKNILIDLLLRKKIRMRGNSEYYDYVDGDRVDYYFDYVDNNQTNYYQMNFDQMNYSITMAIINNRYCRVTYVLDRKFNVWFPCFVTYFQYNYVNVSTSYLNNGYRSYDLTSSKNFTDILIEKGTNNTSRLPVFYDTLSMHVPSSLIQDYDKDLKTKIYEPTDAEKEIAKEAFIQYSGRRAIWDKNPDGNKYLTWVYNGRKILSVENKTPSFPILNYNKESHLIGVVVFSFGILFILFSIVFFYMSFKNRNK